MRRAEFHQHVGHENICANIQDALSRAAKIAREGRPSEAVLSATVLS
jgi:hypothetical protein